MTNEQAEEMLRKDLSNSSRQIKRQVFSPHPTPRPPTPRALPLLLLLLLPPSPPPPTPPTPGAAGGAAAGGAAGGGGPPGDRQQVIEWFARKVNGYRAYRNDFEDAGLLVRGGAGDAYCIVDKFSMADEVLRILCQDHPEMMAPTKAKRRLHHAPSRSVDADIAAGVACDTNFDLESFDDGALASKLVRTEVNFLNSGQAYCCLPQWEWDDDIVSPLAALHVDDIFSHRADKTTGEVETGVRELISLSKGQGTVLEGWRSASREVQEAIAKSLAGDEGASFMVVGGKDMRNGMTEDERDKFIKGMAKMAQNNSMKVIEGMAEQVGKELRGELDRQKEAVRMQQEQIQTQQGQIQQLVDLVRTLGGGTPPLLAAMMEGAEGAAEG
jgi:hypothetical protein